MFDLQYKYVLFQPPYVPKVSHPGDARNFDDYPEDWSDTDSSVTEEQLAIFQDF